MREGTLHALCNTTHATSRNQTIHTRPNRITPERIRCVRARHPPSGSRLVAQHVQAFSLGARLIRLALMAVFCSVCRFETPVFKSAFSLLTSQNTTMTAEVAPIIWINTSKPITSEESLTRGIGSACLDPVELTPKNPASTVYRPPKQHRPRALVDEATNTDFKHEPTKHEGEERTSDPQLLALAFPNRERCPQENAHQVSVAEYPCCAKNPP